MFRRENKLEPAGSKLRSLNEVVAELQRTAEAVDASALNEPRLRSVLPDLVLGRPVVISFECRVMSSLVPVCFSLPRSFGFQFRHFSVKH